MEEVNYRWLPHLEGAVPPAGQGKRISTYTVALEGWRRGLDLNFYSKFEDGNKLKVRYSLGLKNKVHHFSLSMGDKVTEEAFKICDDKHLTKQYLLKNNVPVPGGKMFDEKASEDEIISYALSLGFPLVVKPTDGNAGKGVFANIQSEEDLREIVPHIRHELGFSNIIVEEYISGEEFRIFVIEDRVLGAMNRRPASIKGDGVHTIRELIRQKNKVRKINPHLTSRLIKIDKEIETILDDKGYTLNTVPKKDEVVYLREKSNLSAGGDAVDVTKQLTPEINEIAINAGKAIPGLKHYGVDMIVNKDRSHGVILEVNTRPGIGGHLFPGEGQPRDFAKEIIDYYFPETKDKEKTTLFFDFDSVLEPIKKRSASNVNVMKPPLGKLYGRKYVVTGDFNVRSYTNYIRRQAQLRHMHGYTEQMDDDQLIIVVVSTVEEDIKDFKNVCYDGPEKDRIANIDEMIWNKPVKIGFENRDNLRLTKREARELINERDELLKANERLEKKYNQIRNSRSWRITSPIRYVLHNLKIKIRTLKTTE